FLLFVFYGENGFYGLLTISLAAVFLVKKHPPVASKMLARCPTLLRFFPCIRAFFPQKTVSQADCQQTLRLETAQESGAM
ncbi:hypothetical protein, partial [Neisseria bacilliformis]|uniref:hypothetical protein n=1 Tax=Neisseria bacilliformis TaxID=267212 RepID=UPI003C774A52